MHTRQEVVPYDQLSHQQNSPLWPSWWKVRAPGGADLGQDCLTLEPATTGLLRPLPSPDKNLRRCFFAILEYMFSKNNDRPGIC